MRKKKKSFLPKFLIFTIIGLLTIYIVISYYRSLSDLRTLQQEEAQLKERIVELNEEIEGLNNELERVTSNKSIIENARTRLNMIMPSEIMIITNVKDEE